MADSKQTKSTQTAEPSSQPKGRDLSGGVRGGEKSKPEEAPEMSEPPIVERNAT